MIDGHGRVIDYLRISITDRCDLRCTYCMPEQGVEPLPHEQILTYDEILRIVRVMAAHCGLKKIKVTGGEPLVRKGCPGLVAALRSTPGVEQVTLTTNGVTLAAQMDALAKAGVGGINVSLDTLDRQQYARITRRDRLEQVLAGLEAAKRYPEIPLKINCVPISETPQELVALAGLAQRDKIHVRFIEVMPIGCGRQFRFRSEAEIVALLGQAYGPLTPVAEVLGNGPSHYYAVPGFAGRIGFISAISHKFCDQCNRIRLTSEGFLKTCLQYDTGTDLRGLLRSGCTDEALLAAITRAVEQKPLCHSFFETKTDPEEQRGMNRIGG